jgi:3,4-dihydroxy 2-butanone 4-phosphate synthase/GTP cyclohydrolase II
MAGQAVTPEAVTFMSRQGGVIGIATTLERCAQLGLPPIPERGRNGDNLGYHITFEARHGVSTGISAFDRARTIRVASDPSAGHGDVVMPGHIVPAAARLGGVFERLGLAEAAVDLARLAGLFPVVARCALLDDDGELLAAGRLEAFCENNKLCRVSVDDVRDARVRAREWDTADVFVPSNAA